MYRQLGSGGPQTNRSPWAWSLSALRWGLLGVLGLGPISCGWFGDEVGEEGLAWAS